MASRLRFISISISATSLVACTQLSPLRENTDANPHNSVVIGAGYKVAFIEFGEQGSYQDTSQLKNAIELVQNTNKPLVITYVHGWQNNAESGDVQRFSGLLSRLNQASAIRDAGFNVIGVYMAWRGKLTPVPALKEISFWNRKATAERIASNFDCYDAIAAISEAARKYHGLHNQYTILLGHSFGGLIVERSVAHAINAEMHGHADADRSLPADLILHNQMLINYVTEKLPKTIPSHGLPAFETNLKHNLVGDVFTLDGPNGSLELWHIKRVSAVDVPYWDVSVDPSIIKNHGDLWNERAEAMMAAIFRIANPKLNRYAKPRAILQKPPDFNRLQYRQH